MKKIKLHKALTCKLGDCIDEIARKMREKKERRIFVVDNSGNLKGIITTIDLVYKVLPNSSVDIKVEDVMENNVKSIDIKEDMEKSLWIMNELKTFTCPVTEDGKILGLISYHDIVGYVISSIEK